MCEDIKAALVRVGVAWIGGLMGLTLSQWVLVATLIYTALQTAFLIWKWRKEAK